MKDFIKVQELSVGDVVDTSIGFTYTVTDIEKMPSFGTPEYKITAYTNMDDEKKPFDSVMSAYSVVKIIGHV